MPHDSDHWAFSVMQWLSSWVYALILPRVRQGAIMLQVLLEDLRQLLQRHRLLLATGLYGHQNAGTFCGFRQLAESRACHDALSLDVCDICLLEPSATVPGWFCLTDKQNQIGSTLGLWLDKLGSTETSALARRTLQGTSCKEVAETALVRGVTTLVFITH